MCIAILKEANVEMPSDQILKRCWMLNDDGAGYAYLTEDDTWFCRKGFQTFESFLEDFKSHNFEKENTVIIHFRVGTSGKMITPGVCSPDCTHPFPITDDEDLLNAHTFETPNIMMHNGTYAHVTGPLSDTQIAVRDVLDPLMPYIEDPKILKLLTRSLHGAYKNSCRWFFTSGRQYYLIGNWIEDKETRVWYSNDGYLPKVEKWMNAPASPSEGWLAGLLNMGKGTANNKVEELNGIVAKDVSTEGIFNWDKWRAHILNTTSTTATPEQKETVTEIFDRHGNVIGLVGDDGSVLWDDPKYEQDTRGSDARICCDNCTAIQTMGDLINGYCMYCGMPAEPDPEDEHKCPHCFSDLMSYDWAKQFCPWCYSEIGEEDTEEGKICPNCGDKEYLTLSTQGVGDTECCRCGACFLDNVKGKDSIVGWDHDVRREYDDFLRIIMGKSSTG